MSNSPYDDLEGRVSALEHQVNALGRDAAAARILAGAADRDVSELRVELRGHTAVLNALRETQLEQGEQLATHGEQLATHGEQLATLDRHITSHGEQISGLREEVREGFAQVGIGIARISALLAGLTKPNQQ